MKQPLLHLLFSILLIGKSCFAGGDNFAAGARATALSGASITLADVFATTNNQAGLGFMDKFSLGIYSDRKFLNAAVNNFNLAVALPIKKVGAFGLSTNFYGYKLYNETKIGIAYSRLFGTKFSLGVQFDFLRLSIAENGNRNFYTLEMGFMYRPWKKLFIGAHVYNPIPYKVEKVFGERLPTIIKFGLGYEPSEKVLLCAEYEQDIHYKPRFKSGIEYRPIKYIHIRAGGQTTPFAASFGTGINVAGLNIDLATSFHPTLGFTPQAALVYSFKKKNKNEAPVK